MRQRCYFLRTYHNVFCLFICLYFLFSFLYLPFAFLISVPFPIISFSFLILFVFCALFFIYPSIAFVLHILSPPSVITPLFLYSSLSFVCFSLRSFFSFYVPLSFHLRRLLLLFFLTLFFSSSFLSVVLQTLPVKTLLL